MSIPDELKSLDHFLSIRDHGPEVMRALVDFAIRRKADFLSGRLQPTFQGKVLALIFQKSSLRTRVAFETAMAQLGGSSIYLEDNQVGLGTREDVSDVARVISSMCNAIAARVFGHHLLVEMVRYSRVPVINALSDWAHPCQAVSDIMTIQEHFGGDLRQRKLAYIGDGNNVARSLLNACGKIGMPFAIASPPGYQLDPGIIESTRSWQGQIGTPVVVTDDPRKAVENADVVYTDVWTSMGQEQERLEREKAFAGYQVNADLVKLAKPTAIIMHCLPAKRTKEIAPELIDCPQSAIFRQAENRLHSQRALLEILLSR